MALHRQLLLLLFVGIALQHVQADLFKDTEKLFSKLLKVDDDDKKGAYDVAYKKDEYGPEEEETFLTKLVKDTNKLFKAPKFDLFKPISFKDLFGKTEKELKKIEEKKKDFDNKVIDFISEKTDVKKIFDKILDKDEIKEEKKDDYLPKVYPDKEVIPIYKAPKKEIYKKVKYVDFEDEDEYDCEKKKKDSCEDDYLGYLPPPAPKYPKQPAYSAPAYIPPSPSYTPYDDYNIKYYD